MQIEIVDRYSALGIPRPRPETVCFGECEGIGHIPVFKHHGRRLAGRCEPLQTETPELLDLWQSEHDRHCNPAGVLRDLLKYRELWYWKSIGRDILRLFLGHKFCDGWHFVKCPDCNGTGKRPAQTTD